MNISYCSFLPVVRGNASPGRWCPITPLGCFWVWSDEWEIVSPKFYPATLTPAIIPQP